MMNTVGDYVEKVKEIEEAKIKCFHCLEKQKEGNVSLPVEVLNQLLSYTDTYKDNLMKVRVKEIGI